MVNATSTTRREKLWRLERGIARALLLLGAFAGMTLGSTAHAQVAFRSSTSATSASGTLAAPALRAAISGGMPITIVGEARMPATDDSVTTATCVAGVCSATIVPPSGMQTKDVILVFANAMTSSSVNISNAGGAEAGGQSWWSVSGFGTSPSQKVFYTVFNGTWTANPTFRFGSTAVTYQLWMVVLRGSDTLACPPCTKPLLEGPIGAARIDPTATFGAPLSPFNVIIPASTFTTTTNNAMVFAQWMSADDNTWALQSPPAGWSNLSAPPQPPQPQWRTMAAAGGAGADTSMSIAYSTQATAGPVPALTNQQTGPAGSQGDAGQYHIVAVRPEGIRKPPGTVAGDVMIASIAYATATPTITWPGWTLIRRTPSAGSTYALATYYRVADASDASVSSYVFTMDSQPTNGWVGGIQSFSGVDTTTLPPYVVESGQITASALTHATPSGLTTGAVANTLLVATHMAFNGSITGWTPPVGMTETLDLRTGIGGVVTMETSNVVQAAPGTIPIKTATISGATGYAGAAHILALRGRAWTGTATTISATFASNVVAGNLIAVYVTYDGTGTLNSVTDSLGNTYTIVQTLSDGTHVQKSATAYAKNIAGGANTVTATFASAICCRLIIAHEITGADTAAPLDGGLGVGFSGQLQAAPGNGANAVTSGNMTTVTNGDYIFGATSDSSGLTSQTISAGTGETVRVNSSGATGNATASEENIQATAGAVASTFTFNVTAGTSLTMQMAFKPPPAGGTPGSFNAFETITAANATTGQIYTKLAGTNFSLDVVAILSGVQQTTFTNTAQVDLVTGSTGGSGCPGAPVTIAGPQAVSLTSGRGTTGAFNVASAYRDVRVRVRYPTVVSPTVTSCSTDNFSIRPVAFSAPTSNMTNSGTLGTPFAKAGAAFTITAVAIAGYDGTPTLDNTKITAHAGAVQNGAVGGTFGAANPATGTATGAAFTYGEVGNFTIGINGVLDNTFTNASTDQGNGDCTADFSNSLVPPVGGRYGCYFGNSAASLAIGRFTPDHFDISLNTPVFTTGCGAGAFTYVGQTFSYTLQPVITVTAKNSAALGNQITQNYQGASWWKITNLSLTGKSYTAAPPSLDTSGITGTDPVILATGSGVGTLTFSSGTGLFFTRTTPVAPFNAEISLAINVIDADGVSAVSNPVAFGAASAGNGIAFSSGKEMRFGRLRLSNASGSTLLDLPLPLSTQYYDGNFFVTNTADSCTTLLGSDLRFGFLAATPNLVACETAINPGGTIFFVGGKASATASPTLTPAKLAKPGSGNDGAVDIWINLNGIAGNRCTAVGAAGPAATNANKPWLQGNWSGGTYTVDPTGRATFGIFKNADQFLYFREVY